LCEKGSGAGFDEGSISSIKVLGSKNNHKQTIDLSTCHAIPHPSTNAIFLF